MKQFPKFESCAVINSMELAQKIKNVKINDDEVLISFDVEALFPSIPIKHALTALRNHLEKQYVSPEKINVYLNAARMCMDMNFFEFRGRFFKIDSGTSMGNPLSPLISEAFMSAFEMNLKSKGCLPRIWHRYVDDVVAVVKRDEVDSILSTLNCQYDEINFTYEIEQNNSLVFLDLVLQRRPNGNIELAVHHKPTGTDRYIPSDSYAPIQHKLAAFHSLAHRLVSLPLSPTNYMAEYQYIQRVAHLNGYSTDLIDQIIKKHAHKQDKNNLSTLFTQPKTRDKDDLERRAITFYPSITNGLKINFRRNGLEIVHSNPFKLKSQLISSKDKRDKLDSPGVYEITCSECNRKYYGQTKRSIRTRCKEHCSYIQKKDTHKSAIAAHTLTEQHPMITIDNVRVRKSVNNTQKLDAIESMLIHRDNNAINADKGNIISNLFTL